MRKMEQPKFKYRTPRGGTLKTYANLCEVPVRSAHGLRVSFAELVEIDSEGATIAEKRAELTLGWLTVKSLIADLQLQLNEYERINGELVMPSLVERTPDLKPEPVPEPKLASPLKQ
jgi:hypothetical protein